MGGGDRKTRAKLATTVSNLAAWQIASAFFLLGLLGLFLSNLWQNASGANSFNATLQELAALFVVTGAVTVLWELRGRRILAQEVLAAARLSSEVEQAGLKRVTNSYHGVDWDEYLTSATQVDLFFAYARTWRNAHQTALRTLVSRADTRLRVVLPDRTNEQLMKALARKFNYEPKYLSRSIQEAEEDFATLAKLAHASAEVSVRRTAEFPVFTLYRFDRSLIAVLYGQTPGRVDVPAFDCIKGGTLYGFFGGQFDGLWENGADLSG